MKRSPEEVTELRRKVDELGWFHTIDLGSGIKTPGFYDPSKNLDRMGIPRNLEGLTVLDVGAWDGFYSFEAKRRGAERVLATDRFAWEVGGTKQGFELAREALGLEVEDRTLDVLDISAEEIGQFDVVFFLGVLYHLRDPMLGLERVAEVTRRLLILETHVDLLWTRRPAAAFYPFDELEKDVTNWWGPNALATVAMLEAVGFQRVQIYSRGRRRDSLLYRTARGAVLPYRAARALKEWQKQRTPIMQSLQRRRMVFHAWK